MPSMSKSESDARCIDVRPFRPEDTARNRESFVAAVRQIASRDYSPEQVNAWAPETGDEATWAARRSDAHTYVACLAGHVVGFSDFTDEGVVDMLFVHPDAARRGVARALLERVLHDAASAGHLRLEAHASITARPVFERLGFCVDATRQVQVRGQVLQNFDMHVELGNRPERADHFSPRPTPTADGGSN
jgi:putative acetyltransferase